ncbi:phosphotransferase family protein [Oceaniglobus roseus]|uniref:phosphotransferase family protein n=1 Tax=Oceaniglobus roseus TaxID=1737570 RepID=UPI0012FFE0E1|nr:phosphotransferase [Kandeliimicrobium roseum]
MQRDPERERPVDQAAPPPLDLRRRLEQDGLIPDDAQWTVLSGGRTNRVWRLDPRGDGGPLVCKIGSAGTDTPLFPNDPAAEAAALVHLAGTGLAPEPLGSLCEGDVACLVYRFQPGATWKTDVAGVAQSLARVHRCKPPPRVRRVRAAPDEILKDAARVVAQLPPGLRERLAALCPRPRAAEHAADVFLHGDPVPGNILCPPGGGAPVLIDWQCPAIGDPVHDAAIFLSPAMQRLGRGRPLDAAERRQFLHRLGGEALAARFALLEPLLTWRMAAHCAWRLARGEADYAAALDAELEHLKQIADP